MNPHRLAFLTLFQILNYHAGCVGGVPRGTKGGQLYFLSPCTDASVKVAEMRTGEREEERRPTDRRTDALRPSVHTLAARNEVWARARTPAGGERSFL